MIKIKEKFQKKNLLFENYFQLLEVDFDYFQFVFLVAIKFKN
jgi:hypothetical protein